MFFYKFFRIEMALADNPTSLPERHVVLVTPRVHWNTGNIGRTCVGAGAGLHLIRPLGFSLEERQVKRAGLDYWHLVKPTVWDDIDAFWAHAAPATEELALLTKRGRHTIWRMPRGKRLFLLLGSETEGLPPQLLSRFAEQTYRIPITDKIRSLNLSTAAGIALYESLRPVPP